MKPLKRRIKYGITITLLALIVILVAVDFTITFSTRKSVYNNTAEIPSNFTAVLLGTSKDRSNGQANAYFFNRIDAAVNLFKAKKNTTHSH